MPNIPRQPSITDPKLYVGDVAEFRQRVEKWLCHFGNSFNAEYSKRGILERSEENSTGAEYGFTLAEVLITLSIIGVVAALTIPGLITKNQEKETVVQLKKAYNTLSNAYDLAQIENGPVESWGWDSKWIDGVGYDPETGSASSVNGLNILIKHMNVIKNCGISSGCFPKRVLYKTLNGRMDSLPIDDNPIGARAVLSDGTMIFLVSWGKTTGCATKWGTSQALRTGCATIEVDINGNKGPNQRGKDFFTFYLTKKGIIPLGTPEETNHSIETTCKNKTQQGTGCTAWVLINENMDYLRRDISWN